MKEQLFSLIRYALDGSASIDRKEIADKLPEIYKLAKKYDLTQIVAYSLEKLGISNERFFKEKGISVYRTEMQKYTAKQICSALETEEIPHMLLKGKHIRKLYPEEWMRPSCDVDVYVDNANLDKAAEALEAAGFVKGGSSPHDISLTAPNGYHTELHFKLIEEEWLTGADNIFDNIWQHSEKVTDYRYRMNNRMLYFYHIAHMAKHIKNGGCGIRPFIDLWLLNKGEHSDEGRQLCEENGLGIFEKSASQLAEVWLSGKEHTDTTLALEEYIFSGNLYGSLTNNTVIRQKNAGNRFNYVWARLFMPYAQLSKKYPTLSGKPYLYPIYTLRRWLSLFNSKISSRVKSEMAVTRHDIDSVSKLFSSLGL